MIVLWSARVGSLERNVLLPYFFVSYAHDQGHDDQHVRRFSEALRHDVLLLSSETLDSRVGFCDTDLRVGSAWSPQLVEALCQCQAFIALCSPSYFARPSCGKE